MDGDADAARPAQIVTGPRPKHVQLRDLIAQFASDGPPDRAIPSERELMATYDVSRATVRKAIDSLVAEGVLRRTHGKGTFVARPRLQSRLHLASFTQDMRRRGWTPSSLVLSIGLEEPSAEAIDLLQLAPEERAWHIERVRLADGHPIALEEGWYSATVAPDLDTKDLTGSLYTILSEDYGVLIDSAEQTLWGEVTTAANAHTLAAAVNTPLLVFRRVSSAAGIPVEFVVSRYRGDRYQVHMELSAA